MPSLRGERLTGQMADRRPSARLAGLDAHATMARHDCGHLVEWPVVAPRSADIVWCVRCGAPAAVIHVYRRRVTRVVCGVRGGADVPDRGLWHETGTYRIELFCGEPSGHGGDHYDDAFGIAWPQETRASAPAALVTGA